MASLELKEINELLRCMCGLCENIMPLLASEKKALLEFDHRELDRIAKEKDLIVDRLAADRERVRELVRRLSARLGGEKLESIAQLMPLLSSAEREDLGRQYLRFRAKAQEMEYRNASNRVLADEGLHAMEEAINRVAEAAQGALATYRHPGRRAMTREALISRIRTEA